MKGRHPYLVTRAAVLWGSLHAHKSGDKRCLRQLRALASSGCYADEVLTCGYCGCASPSVVYEEEAGPRTVGACHSERLL